MIKILFIHHATGWGGAPKNMIQLINMLDKTKYNVHVLLIKDSIVSEKLKESNISYSVAKSKFYKKHYHYFTHSEAGYVKWYEILSFTRLSILWLLSRYYYAPKELRKYKADIVHLNSSVLTDWLAPSRKLGKVIIHIQEPFRKGKLDLLHYFFRHQYKRYADRIIAISKDNAKRINILQKTTVVYNFVESNYTPINPDSYYSKKCLYVGGSAKIKGFFTLVDALDYLDKNVIIYFAGNYTVINGKGIKERIKRMLPKHKRYLKAIQKIKQHPNAKYVGLIYNVGDYIDKTCCLISPFTIPHFSRPVIEAFLRKKPVIVSDIPGMEEQVKDGKNGVVFSAGNSKKLAAAINKLLKYPDYIKKLGEAGYVEALNRYTLKNIKIIKQLYNSL